MAVAAHQPEAGLTCWDGWKGDDFCRDGVLAFGWQNKIMFNGRKSHIYHNDVMI